MIIPAGLAGRIRSYSARRPRSGVALRFRAHVTVTCLFLGAGTGIEAGGLRRETFSTAVARFPLNEDLCALSQR